MLMVLGGGHDLGNAVLNPSVARSDISLRGVMDGASINLGYLQLQSRAEEKLKLKTESHRSTFNNLTIFAPTLTAHRTKPTVQHVDTHAEGCPDGS